jgi:hypothetical protein
LSSSWQSAHERIDAAQPICGELAPSAALESSEAFALAEALAAADAEVLARPPTARGEDGCIAGEGCST